MNNYKKDKILKKEDLKDYDCLAKYPVGILFLAYLNKYS